MIDYITFLFGVSVGAVLTLVCVALFMLHIANRSGAKAGE